MPVLLEMQHAMRQALFEPEGGHALDEYVVGGAEAAAEALGIYRNTCISVLVNALRLSYPAVCRLVGAAFFEGAARVFIDGALPAAADLNTYGAAWPEFLARFAPAASVPYLGDVARLEWAVNRALHAPDAQPIELARLAALSGEALTTLRLVPHPALGVLQLDYPADAIWRAVLEQDQAAMAALTPSPGPVWLLVERTAAGAQVVRLPAPAGRFAAALCASEPLAQAAAAAGEFPIEQWLAEHLAAGRFIDALTGRTQGELPWLPLQP
jgi:hypothetical protein